LWRKLKSNKLLGLKLKQVKKPIKQLPLTLSDYLKAIGKAGGYVDRRKNHYRTKTEPFTSAQLKRLRSIKGVIEVKNEMLPHPLNYNVMRKRGIIKTKEPLRKTLMSK